MPGSARERLRNIMMATEHGTRSPDHLQIELLQLVAELLIEIKDDLGQQTPARPAQPPVPAPTPTNGNGSHPQPKPGSRPVAFGL